MKIACKDRIDLAKKFLRTATYLKNNGRSNYRSLMSRAYYSMYHAARATVYFMHGGDDHEEHSKLPTNLPDDFPNKNIWVNDLKLARLERNKADYDPYPNDIQFKSDSLNYLAKAHDLIRVTTLYLQSKGLHL